ncbi:hypothetical protein MG290_11045 [Flavobacterium sp. CBA20B-1]|uniref:hypothetical protein n=1 Tax=unclassified Flavobacterium TaxID=196869 RepID=UPI002224A48D|nr:MULTISPECIES: hypothetical protein [unclassified Flavobacterium]WCM41483.1 hypothetical protein MG290_11045 [Flavobacterium sp. CBA20B-1]
MRKILLLLMLFSFCSTTLSAQNKNDETTLDELIINSKTKKKIKKLKIKGFPFYGYYNQNESIVTGINNPPKGKVKSVVFNFNNRYTRFVGQNIEQVNISYLDMEFGILVYEMNDRYQLGNIVSDCEVKFFVSKDHKGDFKVDVSEIDFPEGRFFIGIKVLSETYKNGVGSFYVMMCDNDESVSYRTHKNHKESNKNVFYNLNDGHLKMTLEIEQ